MIPPCMPSRGIEQAKIDQSLMIWCIVMLGDVPTIRFRAVWREDEYLRQQGATHRQFPWCFNHYK
jgi:hypothetical protein